MILNFMVAGDSMEPDQAYTAMAWCLIFREPRDTNMSSLSQAISRGRSCEPDDSQGQTKQVSQLRISSVQTQGQTQDIELQRHSGVEWEGHLGNDSGPDRAGNWPEPSD